MLPRRRTTASINTQQAFWGSPLMNLACRDDADPESFELLVAAGARVDDVDVRVRGP